MSRPKRGSRPPEPPPPATTTESEEADLQRLRHLPREIGVLLFVAGIGGILLPGPVGTPFLLMGGVVLWPGAFERLEIAFQRRFPAVHRQSMKQLGRFIDDLERRYPGPGGSPGR